MTRNDARYTGIRGRLVLLVCGLACALGCSTTSGSVRGPSVVVEDGGFSIVEAETLGPAARGRFDRAVDAIDAGAYEEAVELLTAMAAEYPGNTAIQIDLAIAHRHLEDFEDAEAALRQALEGQPGNPVAWNELGITLRRLGRFEEARDAYQRALDDHPEFHHARLNLGVLCDLYLGDLPCALRAYRDYQEQVPNDDQVGIWIADLQNRSNQEE